MCEAKFGFLIPHKFDSNQKYFFMVIAFILKVEKYTKEIRSTKNNTYF